MARAARCSYYQRMPETRTATGTIEVRTYTPRTYDTTDGGPDLVELEITERFTGDIEADGSVRFLQILAKDGGATFTGLERVTGTLANRAGTFVLQDLGALVGTDVTGTWFVVPGSATGQLSGLRGEGSFKAKLGEHARWSLTYWFE